MTTGSRSTDETQTIRISRTVSIGWLFGIVMGIAGWGVSNYVVFMKWVQATERNVEELRGIAIQLNAKDIKDAGVSARVIELERRIIFLEQKGR